MKLTNYVKNLTKKILPILCSLLLVFISVITISNFSPANKVYADVITDTAKKIVNYIKSVSGVINKTVDGIGALPTNLDDSLTQLVVDNLNGNGIYQDGNGNYVFSNQFLNDFYDILNNDSGIDAYVCSDFSSFNDAISSPYTNTAYNDNVVSAIATAKNLISDNDNYIGYFLSCGQYHYNNNVWTHFTVYLIPQNFGFLCCSLDSTDIYKLSFKNTSAGNISCRINSFYQSYNLGSQTFSSIYPTGFSNDAYELKGSYSNFAMEDSLNTIYYGFPSYTSAFIPSYYPQNVTIDFVNYYCSDSVIIAKNVASGSSIITNNTYIAYNVVNHNDITISSAAIQNNNWTNIYNKFVTNVSNEYNQGSDLTRKDVQNIIKKYTDVLLKNIADGLEDLEEKIDDTNEWLDKISRQIDEVNAYLEEIANNLDNGVGSDGCVWTEEDVTRVKQILERFYLYSDDYLNALNDIDTNTDNLESDVLAVKTAIDNLKSYLETWKQKIDYIPTIADNTTNTDQKVGNIQTTLVTVSTALNTIISKLDGIGSGSNVDVTIPSIDPDIIDDIVDITEDKLDDLASLLDVVGYVLQDAMPFCFVALAGVVVNALSSEPVAPDWVIPLSNSDGSISESMELDLSIFDGIHELWISLITILFVFGLISASFKIFQTFGVLVN